MFSLNEWKGRVRKEQLEEALKDGWGNGWNGEQKRDTSLITSSGPGGGSERGGEATETWKLHLRTTVP